MTNIDKRIAIPKRTRYVGMISNEQILSGRKKIYGQTRRLANDCKVSDTPSELAVERVWRVFCATNGKSAFALGTDYHPFAVKCG